jgi:hypothetical protein
MALWVYAGPNEREERSNCITKIMIVRSSQMGSHLFSAQPHLILLSFNDVDNLSGFDGSVRIGCESQLRSSNRKDSVEVGCP